MEGAGLGLTIAAVLVDASDGRLTMRPGASRGLGAALWFPTPTLAAEPAEEEPAADLRPSPAR